MLSPGVHIRMFTCSWETVEMLFGYGSLLYELLASISYAPFAGRIFPTLMAQIGGYCMDLHHWYTYIYTHLFMRDSRDVIHMFAPICLIRPFHRSFHVLYELKILGWIDGSQSSRGSPSSKGVLDYYQFSFGYRQDSSRIYFDLDFWSPEK